MGNEEGRAKLGAAQQAYKSAEGAKGADMDSELQEKWHDRTYNPVDAAERGSISEKLNQDSEKYRKGPGPL